MVVYRITLAKWAPTLTGSGYPARWNSKGYHVIYTAGTRALACLENLVHRSGEGLDQHFSIVEINIPKSCQVETVDISTLPENWFQNEMSSTCRSIGDTWVTTRRTPVLKVPSSLIPEESNFLINPQHPASSDITMLKTVPFRFDRRLGI